MREFISSRRGNIALTGAVALPCAFFLITSGVDYAAVSSQRSLLQSVADKAALASARELIIAQDAIVESGNDSRITSVASSVVTAHIGPSHATTAQVIDSGTAVEVTIVMSRQTYFNSPFAAGETQISAKAVAEAAGAGNICLVGLNTKSATSLHMGRGARISAGSCVVYSNSQSATSLTMAATARLSAELICVSGGVHSLVPETNFTHGKPVHDCPVFDDPLIDRPMPDKLAPCTAKDLSLQAGDDVQLKPGTYCGGINNAGGIVRLSPGVYIMRDGPLRVDGGGSLLGEDVGIFLTGPDSQVLLNAKSHVSLSAPRDGDMAGMLIFEDRTIPVPKGHFFSSDDARNLVGTIYFPNSKLTINAQNPIADQSAYTVILAAEFDLESGPELVLNTDYSGSDVPVPSGIGNNSTPAQPRLVR
jgi:Flp pilus assembly protein TadG